MRKNLAILIAVSVLFGLSFGIYELVLPFFLDARGISDAGKGYIFGVGALLPFLLKIFTGRWSDFVGRKIFYSISLLACAASNFFTPFTANPWLQAVLKSVRESGFEVRRTLHPLLLYEVSRKRFIDFMGKTRGLERLFESFGYPLGAFITAAVPAFWIFDRYGMTFLVCSGLLGSAFLLFAGTYTEPPNRERPTGATTGLLSLKLNKSLYILIASSLLFNVGLSCSHSFVPQLFFARKFGASQQIVAVILMLHRVFMAVPMIFVGRLVRGDHRNWCILFMVVEGFVIAGSALIPHFYLATGVWLLHDLFGAGLWVPVQSALVLKHCNSGSRGADVGKVAAISAVTLSVGPVIAGYLTGIQGIAPQTAIGLPFIVGGLIISLASLPLFFL